MYVSPEDVVLTDPSDSHMNALCDWCDSPAVAMVALYRDGRTLEYDAGACADHLAHYFGPVAGRIVTDHRTRLTA